MLYLKPNHSASDGVTLVAHCWDNSGNSEYVVMTKVSDDMYQAALSRTYTGVVFFRKDPSNPNNSLVDGQYYNKTADLQIPTNGNNCFTINENEWDDANGSWSKVQEPGIATIPAADGNAEGSVLKIHYWNDSGDSGDVTMTKAVQGNFKDVWKAEIPGNATHLCFWSGDTIPTSGSSITVDLDLPEDMANNCFYADSSDKCLFDGSKRNGYWGQPYQIRSAEFMKDTDVVDIPTGTFAESANTIYIPTTFYDYYTDYELNGNNRDDYGTTFSASFQSWYNFRHFNQALSDYYKSKSAVVPIYVGHFQPDWEENGEKWGIAYSDIAGTLNLYGFKDGQTYYSTNADQRYFMSVNNSHMDASDPPTGGHTAAAAQGIVGNSLSGYSLTENSVNYGILQPAGSSTAMPFFDEDFLSGNNSKNTKLGEVYKNVGFPFTLETKDNGVAYWSFDSSKTTLQIKENTGSRVSYDYYLTEASGNQYYNLGSGSDQQTTKGFFPFNHNAEEGNANTYNYGIGTRIDLTFNLTKNGMVTDKYGNEEPIVFEFSGDDDVWVFIDGKLVLDIGGAHGEVDGKIDFANNQATVSRVKSSGGSRPAGQYLAVDFSLNGDYEDEHTLTMFYMERGMWESNMMITFNFFPPEEVLPEYTTMTVEKEWDIQDTSKKTNV